MPTCAYENELPYFDGMNASIKYEKAAPSWSQKALRLGYNAAYANFLTGEVLATGSVLDVGTGTGTFAHSWIEAGGSKKITLLDPSRAMLDRAHAHFKEFDIHPEVVNLAFEDFQSGTEFGAILASHVLEHFDDPALIMQQFARMLSPCGRLYLNVSKPHWCNWMIWLRFRHRWFRPEVVCEMAQDAGLTKVKVHEFLTGPPSRTSLGYVFSKP